MTRDQMDALVDGHYRAEEAGAGVALIGALLALWLVGEREIERAGAAAAG